ncbi:MAG: hypothetical protein BroJett014_25090 [Planctomycetota bacterium]|jgi:hypothetical protein|nr:MAG: hypothetical protein BroJett014_25090 [Planctomycetota bacterium]
MTRKHWLFMAVGCGLPVLALAAVYLWRVQLSTLLLFGLVLLCPLLHLLMLRDHQGHTHLRQGESDG